MVSAESPAPSRHAVVPDLPAAAPIPRPQSPAAEQPAEALAVNTPEPSGPVSKAPDLPAEAATPELHPQVAEKPAKAVNTPEHHLDASPPNYTALPPIATAPPSVDVTALPGEQLRKSFRNLSGSLSGSLLFRNPLPPLRPESVHKSGSSERRRMPRQGLMSPGFVLPR